METLNHVLDLGILACYWAIPLLFVHHVLTTIRQSGKPGAVLDQPGRSRDPVLPAGTGKAEAYRQWFLERLPQPTAPMDDCSDLLAIAATTVPVVEVPDVCLVALGKLYGVAGRESGAVVAGFGGCGGLCSGDPRQRDRQVNRPWSADQTVRSAD